MKKKTICLILHLHYFINRHFLLNIYKGIFCMPFVNILNMLNHLVLILNASLEHM